VRLRLYYQLVDRPESVTADHLSIRLARLMIVQESRRFTAPMAVVGMGRDVLAQDAESVAAALAKTGALRAWRIQDREDSQEVTLTSESAGVLLATLSRTIFGPPPTADLAGFVIEPVPVGPEVDQFAVAARCVEILAISAVSEKMPTLLALAVAAPVRDNFWEMIISAARR
jgi:hypothetical protein